MKKPSNIYLFGKAFKANPGKSRSLASNVQMIVDVFTFLAKVNRKMDQIEYVTRIKTLNKIAEDLEQSGVEDRTFCLEIKKIQEEKFVTEIYDKIKIISNGKIVIKSRSEEVFLISELISFFEIMENRVTLCCDVINQEHYHYLLSILKQLQEEAKKMKVIKVKVKKVSQDPLIDIKEIFKDKQNRKKESLNGRNFFEYHSKKSSDLTSTKWNSIGKNTSSRPSTYISCDRSRLKSKQKKLMRIQFSEDCLAQNFSSQKRVIDSAKPKCPESESKASAIQRKIVRAQTANLAMHRKISSAVNTKNSVIRERKDSKKERKEQRTGIINFRKSQDNENVKSIEIKITSSENMIEGEEPNDENTFLNSSQVNFLLKNRKNSPAPQRRNSVRKNVKPVHQESSVPQIEEEETVNISRSMFMKKSKSNSRITMSQACNSAKSHKFRKQGNSDLTNFGFMNEDERKITEGNEENKSIRSSQNKKHKRSSSSKRGSQNLKPYDTLDFMTKQSEKRGDQSGQDVKIIPKKNRKNSERRSHLNKESEQASEEIKDFKKSNKTKKRLGQRGSLRKKITENSEKSVGSQKSSSITERIQGQKYNKITYEDVANLRRQFIESRGENNKAVVGTGREENSIFFIEQGIISNRENIYFQQFLKSRKQDRKIFENIEPFNIQNFTTTTGKDKICELERRFTFASEIEWIKQHYFIKEKDSDFSQHLLDFQREKGGENSIV